MLATVAVKGSSSLPTLLDDEHIFEGDGFTIISNKRDSAFHGEQFETYAKVGGTFSECLMH